MNSLRVTLVFALLSLFARPALAASVTIEFSGAIVADELQLPSAFVPFMSVGSLVTGRYTYDDARSDSDPAVPSHGEYDYPESQFHLDLTLGGVSLETATSASTLHLSLIIEN